MECSILRKQTSARHTTDLGFGKRKCDSRVRHDKEAVGNPVGHEPEILPVDVGDDTITRDGSCKVIPPLPTREEVPSGDVETGADRGI